MTDSATTKVQSKMFRILDGKDDLVLGGDVSEDNVYVRVYGSTLRGEKRPTDLAIGESTRKRYALSGQKPTVYRILRIS